VLLTKKHVDKVIVVDDGTTDMTAEIAGALGAEVIQHKKNIGKGAAIKTIFEKAKKYSSDILVLLDADGQHNPNDIPRLLSPIINGQADIVIGSRFKGRSNIPKYRKIGLKILSKLARNFSRIGISDPLSGFRALSRKAYESINLTENGYGTEIEMLILAKERGLRIMEVPIEISYDTGTKTSKKSPVYQAAEIASTIVRKTIERKPLLYLGTPGMIMICVGVYFAIELIKLFNATRYFSVPMAFLTLGFTLTGLALLTTSLIIYVIAGLITKDY